MLPTFELLAFGLALAIGTLASPSLIISKAASPDNTCGTTGNGGNPSSFSCSTDLPCCSVNVWCGNTDEYCLVSNGCQGDFGTCVQDSDAGGGNSDQGSFGNAQCGPDNDNMICAPNECCSAAGFCGTTSDHCKVPDCLFQSGPACDADKIPPGQNTSSIARPWGGQIAYGGPGIYSCVNPGDVALTYDDGPDKYLSDLLDLLKGYNASATFVIIGNNNAKGEIDDLALPWASIIKRMYIRGHQFASHTWSHADLCKITSVQRKNEMYKLEMALRNIIGVFPTCMRPPFSSCAAECGCENDMAALGYSIIYFELDTADYLHDSPSEISQSEDIVDHAIDAKPSPNGSFLVIGHDIHQQTVYSLTEYMLQNFQGKKMVTLGECLGVPKENWYRADTRITLD
ncbi:chitin deacetylase [Colletotrichum truncatum]|uniref:Chitin deacetylase n=1 Tax=Colletotrichum truncatum TaxID=5467 RepID=A0ACC3YXF9_COLTU|nr:chitin deacetylase [Colletotrichum truncatum]KAF6792407.1 chitin deacetylase [Colletotrichum truncatum]